jgi:hypothetical protein
MTINRFESDFNQQTLLAAVIAVKDHNKSVYPLSCERQQTRQRRAGVSV